MAFLSLGLFSLTCQFKLSFPLSLASKLQGSWGWSFSLAPPFEAELPCREESKAWREESKAWRKKRHEESGSVTSGPTFPVLLFVPGTFPVFHIKKSKNQKMPGVRLFCAAPLPGAVNPGSCLPPDPSSPLKACTCAGLM